MADSKLHCPDCDISVLAFQFPQVSPQWQPPKTSGNHETWELGNLCPFSWKPHKMMMHGFWKHKKPMETDQYSVPALLRTLGSNSSNCLSFITKFARYL